MDARQIPASYRNELATWTARKTAEMMQDPQTRKEFETWRETRKKSTAEAVPGRTSGGSDLTPQF